MGQYAEENMLTSLGALYESYGYALFKTSTFEEYDFYARYKSFLRSEPIVSFTSTDGRLMALKPDVTLSIAKNAPDDPDSAMKVYYRESVYRQGRSTRELREITQAGLELIGRIDRYSLCEVVLLAIKSLRAIGGKCELAISHMGITGALIAEAGLTGEAVSAALSAISRKSSHELSALVKDCGAAGDRLMRLISVYGPLETRLDALTELAGGGATAQAVEELRNLLTDLRAFGEGDMLTVDFSTINDMDYYGGVIFRGFAEGISHPVLSGGRYDNLIDKLGKKGGAVGFAVYPDVLEARLGARDDCDADTLLLYDDSSDPGDVARAAEMFRQNGQSVLVQRAAPPSGRYRRRVRMSGRGFEMEC